MLKAVFAIQRRRIRISDPALEFSVAVDYSMMISQAFSMPIDFETQSIRLARSRWIAL